MKGVWRKGVSKNGLYEVSAFCKDLWVFVAVSVPTGHHSTKCPRMAPGPAPSTKYRFLQNPFCTLPFRLPLIFNMCRANSVSSVGCAQTNARTKALAPIMPVYVHRIGKLWFKRSSHVLDRNSVLLEDRLPAPKCSSVKDIIWNALRKPIVDLCFARLCEAAKRLAQQ